MITSQAVRATVVGVALLLAVGCSASGSGGSSGSVSRSPGSPGSASGSAGPSKDSRSAEDLVAEAISLMSSASAVHVSGVMPGVGNIDLHLGSHSAKGTQSLGGVTVRFVAVNDTMYVKAPASVYTESLPRAQRARVNALVRGKWVKAPGSAFPGVATYSSAQGFLAPILKLLRGDSNWTRGDVMKMNGVAAVQLTNPARTFYVPAHGLAYPVELVYYASGEISISFDSWMQKISVAAPPPSQVVDLSELAG